MKVDFKKLPVYTSIKKDVTEEFDASFLIANTIYTQVGGLVAHSLAMRIYEQGEVELNEKEVELIRKVADGFVGVLADSIKDRL
jgi:hypothetical protein